MAAAHSNIEQYCNSIYTELTGMKDTIGKFLDQIEQFSGKDKEHVASHAEHLKEISKTIDWKLDIIAKACPLDTTGFAKGAQTTASVPLEEPAERGKRTGGGSVGG